MREMKDSGIDWIGQIPTSWNVSKVKYFYDCYDGKRVPIDASLRKEGPYPYWGAGSVTDHVDSYLFDEELVLVGEDGAPFFDPTRPVSFIINEKVWVNNHIHVLKIKENTDPTFMVYYFNSVDYGSYINGSILNKLTQGNMNNIAFVFPGKEEQKRIAEYLDSKCAKIDSIIAKQEKIIERLKEYKLAVINESITNGLNHDVDMVESGDDRIGMIPRSWVKVKITRLLDYSKVYPIGDGDHGLIKTDDYLEEGIPYLRVQNLGWGTDLLLDNVVYISEENNERIKNSELHPDDILFCKTGATIGKTGIVPNTLPKANTTSHVGKFTIDKKYNARYVFYYLSSQKGFMQFWDIACMKSTRPELSIEETKGINVAIPKSRKEQDEIVKYLDKICPEIDIRIRKEMLIVEKLQEYKKSLIYEVVTGKKEV